MVSIHISWHQRQGRGKVLVVEVAGSFILGIGLEVASKSAVAAPCSLHNLQRIDAMLIPCNCLLIWKVDLQAANIGLDSMHPISHQPPKGLTLRNIVCIQIELDLILTCAKLHGGMIVALADIFVDILDPLDRPNTLYVDIASVLSEQKDAEWNDKTIVNLLATGKSV